jgi:hypothetical protein
MHDTAVRRQCYSNSTQSAKPHGPCPSIIDDRRQSGGAVSTPARQPELRVVLGREDRCRPFVPVELTPKGRTLVEEMDSDVMDAHEGWYSALTPAEQRRLESLLKKTSAVLKASVGDP